MVALVSIAAILLSVGVHAECIGLVAGARVSRQRLHFAAAMLAIVVAHLIEVLIFAVGWWLLLATDSAELTLTDPGVFDLVYFSGSAYTSLGFGDILPLGTCRLYSIVEAVTGLVLIAWSASYTYLHMKADLDRRNNA